MKIRWDSLKFQYRRHVAKYDSKSGQPAPRWRLERQMSFLNDTLFVDRRRTCSIADDFQPSIDSDSSEGGRKRKLLDENDSTFLMDYILRQRDLQEHPVEIFFKMIASTVKQFSDFDQHVVKTKVFQIVNDIEAKYVLNSSSHQPPSPTPSCIQTSPVAYLASPQNSQSPEEFTQ